MVKIWLLVVQMAAGHPFVSHVYEYSPTECFSLRDYAKQSPLVLSAECIRLHRPD
jgi:hypothetical protein